MTAALRAALAPEHACGICGPLGFALEAAVAGALCVTVAVKVRGHTPCSGRA